MNLEKFLQEASPEDTEMSTSEKKSAVGKQRFAEILAGKEKFEGDVDTPEKIKDVLKALENAESQLSKLAPRSLKVKAIKVKSIMTKVDKGGKIRENESDFIDDFCDEIEEILMQETYMKAFLANDMGGSGGKVNKIVFSQSFPIRFKTKEGKSFLGLVRPPTGVITWKGDDAKKAVKEAEGIQIPPKLPLIQTGWTVMKNIEMQKLFDTGRIEIRDDEESKKKVVKALKAAGASINDRGDIKGLSKALDAVAFWNAIEKIFQ